MKGEHVVEALTRITAMRGHPGIKVDNDSEFISKAMDRWAHEHGVQLDFTRPCESAKPRVLCHLMKTSFP